MLKNTAKDTTFSRFYSELFVTNIGIFNRIDSLILIQDLDSAINLNNFLTDTNLLETNLKAVNSIIILKSILDSSLSSTDSSTLEAIAIQDPFSGGDAVLRARSLLFKEVHFELPVLKIRNELVEQILPEILPFSFNVVPNPTKEKCKIHLTGMEHNFTIQIIK